MGLYRDVLQQAAELAIQFLEELPERRITPSADLELLRGTLGGALPERGAEPTEVIAALVRDADPGLLASAGPRFFAFVFGGNLPAAVAADWLTSAWDQNAGAYLSSPALSVVEETAGNWLLELLGLPSECSVGFTTGCQMANFTALAAARHSVLRRAGWDVEAQGLQGAPEVRVLVGAGAHVTIFGALRYLGLGAGRAVVVPADAQGRMQPRALREALAAGDGPTIVCAQAGEVNTGAFDPLDEVADAVREHEGVWLHIDGAFGLWAAAVPSLRELVRGHDRADSWASDAHKWLNVPYDSGLVFVRDVAAHRAAMSMQAAYLTPELRSEFDPFDYVPEFSRRARGFAVYAALRSLGRDGIVEMVERNCRQARQMAARLSEDPRATVLNDVVLNQVLVRFAPPEGADPSAAAAMTQQTMMGVQMDGTCMVSGTEWDGLPAMRVSFTYWSTTEDDVERSAQAILRALDTATVP